MHPDLGDIDVDPFTARLPAGGIRTVERGWTTLPGDGIVRGHAAPRRGSLLIVHVFVHVKPGLAEAFAEATTENARKSVEEPGVARFDVIRQSDDRSRFVLVEVYRTPEDPARHKDTAHYQKWRDAVEPMMAEPRRSVKYENVFPGDQGWG